MKIKGEDKIVVSKREIESIKTLLNHAAMDITFKEAGSYGDGDTVDTKEIELGKLGLTNLKFILEELCINWK